MHANPPVTAELQQVISEVVPKNVKRDAIKFYEGKANSDALRWLTCLAVAG